MDREKVINQLDVDIQRAERTGEMLVYVGLKTAKDVLTMLKEQEEMPLRCKKCGYHREDGLCGLLRIYVKDTDYCSLGRWKGQ